LGFRRRPFGHAQGHGGQVIWQADTKKEADAALDHFFRRCGVKYNQACAC
jgi:hypothetical protein